MSKHWVKIVLGLISLAGIVIVGYLQFPPGSHNPPPSKSYSGRVLDGTSLQAVHGAKVSISTDQTFPRFFTPIIRDIPC